jgi:hypothetical protein
MTNSASSPHQELQEAAAAFFSRADITELFSVTPYGLANDNFHTSKKVAETAAGQLMADRNVTSSNSEGKRNLGAGVVLAASAAAHRDMDWFTPFRHQLVEIYISLCSKMSPVEALTEMLDENAKATITRWQTRVGLMIVLAARRIEDGLTPSDTMGEAVVADRHAMFDTMLPSFLTLLDRALADTGRTPKSGWTIELVLHAMWMTFDGWTVQQLGGFPNVMDSKQCASAMVELAFALTEPATSGPRAPAIDSEKYTLYIETVRGFVNDPTAYPDLAGIPEVLHSVFPTQVDLADEIVRFLSFSNGVPVDTDKKRLLLDLLRTAQEAMRRGTLYSIASGLGAHKTAYQEQLEVLTKIFPENSAKIFVDASWNGNVKVIEAVMSLP